MFGGKCALCAGVSGTWQTQFALRVRPCLPFRMVTGLCQNQSAVTRCRCGKFLRLVTMFFNKCSVFRRGTRRTGAETRRTGPGTRRTGTETRRTGLGTRRTCAETRRTGPGTRRTGAETKRTGPGTRRTGTETQRTGPETRRFAPFTERTRLFLSSRTRHFVRMGESCPRCYTS